MPIDATRLEKLRSELAIRHVKYRALLQQGDVVQADLDGLDNAIREQQQQLDAANDDADPIVIVQGEGMPPTRAEKRRMRALLPTEIEQLRVQRTRVVARLVMIAGERDAAAASWSNLARLVERCEAFMSTAPHARLGELPRENENPPVNTGSPQQQPAAAGQI
jgi:hypothetical protein